MNEKKLQTIEQLNKTIQNWKQSNSSLWSDIKVSQQSGQKLCIPSHIRHSRQLKLAKLQQMRCEYCEKRNNIKYICTSRQLYQQHFRYFILCISCFSEDRCPEKISKCHYLLMDQFVDRLIRVTSKSHRRAIHSVNQCQKKIEKLIASFVQKLSSCISKIGDALKGEIKNMKMMCQKETEDFQEFLFQQFDCKCYDSCCYCFPSLARKIGECSLNELKSRRITFAHKFEYLHLFEGMQLQQEETNQMMKDALQMLESTLLKSQCYIQKILNYMNISIQNLHLFDEKQLNNLINTQDWKQKLFTTDYVKQKLHQYLQRESKNGKIDHLTSSHLEMFDNNIKQLSIGDFHQKNYISLQNKFKSITSLEKISIQSQQVGEKLIKEISQSEKNEPFILNQQIKQSLQNLEFNFKTNQRIHLQNLAGFTNIKNAAVYGNFNAYFHQIHEIIGNTIPRPAEIESLASRGILKYLWIGNWSRNQTKEDLDIYCKILCQSFNQLEGIMLGTNTGTYQKICPNLLQILKKTPPKLKILILNQIEIQKQFFLVLLESLPDLEGIFLNDCPIFIPKSGEQNKKQQINQKQKITTEIHHAICNLKNLKKLGINRPTFFAFDKPLPKLQTFILGACVEKNLDVKLVQCLSQSSLVQLNLNGCCYLKESTINKILEQQLLSGKRLEEVNLQKTASSKQTLYLLNRFDHLASLNIGQTQISLCQLLQDLSRGKLWKIQTISKLFMKNMKYLSDEVKNMKISLADASDTTTNAIFAGILNHFPLLSHLDLSKNPTLNDSCVKTIKEGLQHLVYLTVKETNFSQNSSKITAHTRKDCPFRQKKPPNFIDRTQSEETEYQNTSEPHFSGILNNNKFFKIIY